VQMSLTECTAESAYTALVPRLLLPIILHRRLRQLQFARRALARYLSALHRFGDNPQPQQQPVDIPPQVRPNEQQRQQAAFMAARSDAIAAKRAPSLSTNLPAAHISKLARSAVTTSVSKDGGGGSSGNMLTSLYGRLVGHLEREEEVQQGVEWLTSRMVKLQAYCEDMASILSDVLGLAPHDPALKRQQNRATLRLEDAAPMSTSTMSPSRISSVAATAGAVSQTHSGLYRRSGSASGPALITQGIARSASSVGNMLLPAAVSTGSLTALGAAAATAAANAYGSSNYIEPVSTFKPSTAKKDAHLRYLPTNLHVQMLSLAANLLPLREEADGEWLVAGTDVHATGPFAGAASANGPDVPLGAVSTGAAAGAATAGHSSSHHHHDVLASPKTDVAQARRSAAAAGAGGAAGGLGSPRSRGSSDSSSVSSADTAAEVAAAVAAIPTVESASAHRLAAVTHRVVTVGAPTALSLGVKGGAGTDCNNILTDTISYPCAFVPLQVWALAFSA
jgi:hypothetical protein